MGVYLIGMQWADLASISFWWNIIQAALGLGAVIFVHELGHFAVAKMCGVKCEKFYLGFDIKGIKLFHYQWGETEYGIGILPLGGYVKMLGQDDNPGKAREEHERSMLQTGDLPLPVEEDETGKAAPLDPRSYLAQTVPERMAIISAGVIMNVIFAFVVLVAAFMMGVQYVPAQIGTVVPGETAWQVGLHPGDRLLQIGNIKEPHFDDIQRTVSLGDHENGLPLVVERPGVDRPLEFTVKPVKKGLAPRIGVSPALTGKLAPNLPAMDYSPALGEVLGGDRIVKIGDARLDGSDLDGFRLNAVLAQQPDATLRLQVRRKSPGNGKDKEAAESEHEVSLPPSPTRGIGLVMEMGPITAVQAGSPAAAAGLQIDDQIEAVDGDSAFDPMFLSELLRRRAGQEVPLTVLRQGKSIDLTVRPRDPEYAEEWTTIDAPASAPALGIAYRVLSKVARVDAGGPAAGKVQVGALIKHVRLVLPEEIPATIASKLSDKEKLILLDIYSQSRKVQKELIPKEVTWPYWFHRFQEAPLGTQVELELEGDAKVTLDLVSEKNWNWTERGLNLLVLTHTRKAVSLSEGAELGWGQTKVYLLMVYRFIRKIASGQVSLKGAGGPISIATMAFYSAEAGFPAFLTFLAMLSANLAVVNFLPIPVLDGGHMVFLTYEAIRRKPPSEKIVIALSYLGLSLILSLMVWVLLLDFGIISRR